MPTARIKRRRLLIDGPVQIGLVKRIVLHWVTLLSSIFVVLPLYRTIVTGDFATPLSERLTQVGIESAILLTLFAALLPYFIYDTLRLTNRFAGPMYRLHQTIRAVAKDDDVPPLSFREEGYWPTLAEAVHALGRARGYPVVAEAASNVRFGFDDAVWSFDVLARSRALGSTLAPAGDA